MDRLETAGTEKFLCLPQSVNKFPGFVRQVVQRLKAICPRLGKRKIAETLARAGLHLSATTMRRVLREFPKPSAPVEKRAEQEQAVTAKGPNDVWHCDLTTVPTLLGFWTNWLPLALPSAALARLPTLPRSKSAPRGKSSAILALRAPTSRRAARENRFFIALSPL